MTSYVLNEDKMFADITDGIAIVINNETGLYYGLNAFGTSVLENLMKGVSVENICDSLKNLEGAPADMTEKANAFIQEMLAKEILISGNESTEQATFDATVASTDKFELSVKEYNDAQEMLLADPVHEVKEETGWTPEKDSIGYTKEETREREKKMEQ